MSFQLHVQLREGLEALQNKVAAHSLGSVSQILYQRINHDRDSHLRWTPLSRPENGFN